MTDVPEPVAPAAPESGSPAPRTGDPAVDAVIAQVAGVAGRPLDEHVAVFEDAHARLRAALDTDPNQG